MTLPRVYSWILLFITIFFVILGAAIASDEGLRARMAALEKENSDLESRIAALEEALGHHSQAIGRNNAFIEARQQGHGFAFSYALREGWTAAADDDDVGE